MGRPRDRVEPGTEFGRWTVTGPAEARRGVLYYPCRCACGTEQLVAYSHLKYDGSTKCKRCALRLRHAGNPERDGTIRRRRAAGDSLRTIARLVGMTAEGVRLALQRIDVASPKESG